MLLAVAEYLQTVPEHLKRMSEGNFVALDVIVTLQTHRKPAFTTDSVQFG